MFLRQLFKTITVTHLFTYKKILYMTIQKITACGCGKRKGTSTTKKKRPPTPKTKVIKKNKVSK